MQQEHNKLDNLVDEIVRATTVNEDDVNAIAESPFLYRRIRVRISEEKDTDRSILSFWSDLFSTFKLATKVTAAVALIIVFTFFLLPSKSPANEAMSATPVLDVALGDDMFAEAVELPNSAKVPYEVNK